MRQASSTVLAGSFFAIVTLAGCSSSKAPPATPPTPDVQVSSAGGVTATPAREDGRRSITRVSSAGLGMGRNRPGRVDRPRRPDERGP